MDGKILAKNKRANFDYEVLEKFEAGMVLIGAEVKSIKAGQVQMKGSYVTAFRGRVQTENMHVSPYRYAVIEGIDPLRKRQLLLKKKEIDQLTDYSSQKGLTLVPLEILLKKNFIKLIIGVCRGKKSHDKRDVLKHRAENREIEQGLKKFTR